MKGDNSLHTKIMNSCWYHKSIYENEIYDHSQNFSSILVKCRCGIVFFLHISEPRFHDSDVINVILLCDFKFSLAKLYKEGLTHLLNHVILNTGTSQINKIYMYLNSLSTISTHLVKFLIQGQKFSLSHQHLLVPWFPWQPIQTWGHCVQVKNNKSMLYL